MPCQGTSLTFPSRTELFIFRKRLSIYMVSLGNNSITNEKSGILINDLFPVSMLAI